jgi:DNA-binding CsgD family transcriptional regulator
MGKKASVEDGFAFLLDLLGLRAYLVASNRRVVHANTQALAGSVRLDPLKEREVVALVEPCAAPQSFLVFEVDDRACKFHLVIDLRSPADSDATARALARTRRLTKAETEVLVLWARGSTAPQIARARSRGRETVRTQLREIRGRLGIASQVELIKLIVSMTWR